MAATISVYNHTRDLFGGGDVDLANLHCMLVNGYTFAASHTDNSVSVAPSEVSGNGWDAGGEPMANVDVVTYNTNEAKLQADDLSVTASGGTIGPADGAVILDATNDWPLFYIDFGASESAGDGTPFKITWDATNGIHRWKPAA